MSAREIDAGALVTVLNEGPGEPQADVRHAAEEFDVNERTIYRRIQDFGIRRRYAWLLEEAA